MSIWGRSFFCFYFGKGIFRNDATFDGVHPLIFWGVKSRYKKMVCSLVKGLCDFDVSYGGGIVPEQVDLRVQDRHAGRLRLAQR